MLLVILGAGASYDSDRNRMSQMPASSLPLAKDLFSPRFADIARTYDAVQGILGDLRQAANVEEALEGLIAQQDRYPHRVRQLLGATYYLREVIDKAQSSWWDGSRDHVTNYVELIEQIEKWRVDTHEPVTFVTFNYDTLLEAAVHAVIGKSFRTFDDYISEPMAVYKLHGSIDWWQGVSTGWGGNLTGPQWAPSVLDAAAVVQPTGNFQVTNPHTGTGGPVIPAISLPVMTKGDKAFACPQTHLDALRETLPEAVRVLVIGWRGAEAHFYALWKASFKAGQHKPYAVLVVDTDPGVHDAWHNLKTSAPWLPEGVLFKGGFSSIIGSDALAQFLAESLPNF